MSPASGDFFLRLPPGLLVLGFHSINVPSEWGLGRLNEVQVRLMEIVSIQLMSPASGDYDYGHDLGISDPFAVSIQLMSPASGDSSILNPYPARCPETVSEGQEKSSKTTNRQQEKNSQNPYPASDRSSQRKNQYYSHFT